MRHRKPRTIGPCIISEGTLRPEDLIPACLDVLEGLRLSRDERKTVADIARDSDREGYYEDDDNLPEDDISNLANILSAHCAPYCYFGSHPGDGACIGVWADLESLERDIEEENWRETEPEPRQGWSRRVSPNGRLVRVVSDHGNVSLYRNGREVWGIV